VSLTIDEAIARVPMWQGKAVRHSPLGGGITNENFRVEVDGEAFVVRLAGKDTELLGIDREHEFAAHSAAAKLGIAPEIVHFIRPEGYLITRFVAGRPIPAEDMRKPENVRRAAAALRQVHGMPAVKGTFSAFAVVDAYTELGRRHHASFPEDFAWLLERKREIAEAVRPEAASPRPCHNDLLNGNFLDDGELRILDWEYAGMGDPFFDLANFAVNHEFSDEEDHILLKSYFGEVARGRLARLKLMKVMSDFREAMWGVVQSGISALDFDFAGYARLHFGRMTRAFDDPRWGDWLKEARQDA